MSQAERIKYIRSHMRLTQAGFAEALGVSNTSVQNWESGRKPAGVDSLDKIAELSDCSEEWLYGLPGTEPYPPDWQVASGLRKRMRADMEARKAKTIKELVEVRGRIVRSPFPPLFGFSSATEGLTGIMTGERAAAPIRSPDIVPEAAPAGARRKRGQPRGSSFQNRSRSSSSASEERPDSATS